MLLFFKHVTLPIFKKLTLFSDFRFSKGVFWHDLIDYVNQRFSLEIPKDILTDKEREKAILIRDKYSNSSTEK